MAAAIEVSLSKAGAADTFENGGEDGALVTLATSQLAKYIQMIERSYLGSGVFLSTTPTLIPTIRAIATRPTQTTIIIVINVFLEKRRIPFGREMPCSTSSTFTLLACSTASGG